MSGSLNTTQRPEVRSQDATRPAASIVTVNTNELHRMQVYMPSVWAAEGDFEVIIGDNGSIDGSVEFIEENFPETRIIRNGENLGFAAANNRAAEHAQSDILVFLNPDTAVSPDWLTELLKPLEDPSVGLTTAKIVLMPTPDRINACGNDVHISGLTLCRGANQSASNFAVQEDVAAASGAAFAIRRQLFEQVGGFNEGFFIYMEDTALSLESWLRGWRCIYVPTSVVQHDYALRFGPRKTLYQERNRYLLLLQLYRWPTLLALLPVLLLTEILTWGFVLLRDRPNWRNKFRAYAGVFREWSAVQKKRQLNQMQRSVSDRSLLLCTTGQLDLSQVSSGLLGVVAASIVNPMFTLMRYLTLAVVWW